MPSREDGLRGDAATVNGTRGSAVEVLAVCTRLGLTSFGGPVAHLGYFHDEFVRRRRWLRDEEYAELVALCQFLPGPASSQVGIAIGAYRAGIMGSLAAWLGFTLPSAALLVAFALGLGALGDLEGAAWLRGLKGLDERDRRAARPGAGARRLRGPCHLALARLGGRARYRAGGGAPGGGRRSRVRRRERHT